MDKKIFAGKVVELEKKKLKKKTKKAFHRFLFCIFGSVFLFAMGYLFGMHHRLIVSMMKGEEPPKSDKCPAVR